MNSFRTKELLENLSAVTQADMNIVKEKIIILSELQLHWKKDNVSWSIAEIASHLNEFAAYYFDIISKKIDKTRFREPRQTFLSSPLGRSAWTSMKLGNARNVKRKLRSPRMFNPRLNREMTVQDSVQILLANQERLLEILKRSAEVSLRKVRIPMATSKLIRLRLGDALMYVIYHQERHIQQMLNLLGQNKFPQTTGEK